MRLGYFLSSEEHGPGDLVALARRAEEAGFQGLWISDHYHPWIDEQGHSPFVWSVIGAIAQALPGTPLTTAAPPPHAALHPSCIPEAAATSVVLLPLRFRHAIASGY